MLIYNENLKEKLNNYANINNKINREVKKGVLIKLKKGLYETNAKIPGYYLANAIYNPSYLSFDFALAYYGLIPEQVKNYTSATFGKNKKKIYKNYFGTFLYRDVPENVYYYGIKIIEENKYIFQIATPEKALCDKLYTLKPLKNQKQISELLFEDLRIDYNSFQKLNFTDLKILCGLYKNTNMKILEKVIGDFNEDDTRTNGR